MNPALMLRSRSSGLLPVTTSCTFPRHESRLFGRRKASGQSAAVQRLLTYLLVTVMLAGSIYGVMRVGRPGLATGPDDFGLADGAFYDGAAVGAGVGAGALRHKQQHRQQQRHHLHGGSDVHDVHSSEAGALHLHDDVHDRRAAMEERHAATAASAALAKAAAEATLAQQAGQQQRQDAQEQQQQPAVHHSADVEAWDAIGAADTGPDASQVQQAQLEAQHLAELHHLEAQLGGPGSLAQLHPDPDVAAAVAAHIAEQQAMPRREGPSLYSANLSAVDIHGQVLHTADLMGRVTVIVNVASQCGYTEANYRGLSRIHQRYKDFGLEVLAFPCNQFGQQEPGTHAEIEQFVSTHYGSQFPLMSKVEVNGASQHPIFAWLKVNSPPEPGRPEGEDIRWNFAKFLIDKYGHVVKRYSSDLDYHAVELDVYNELIKY